MTFQIVTVICLLVTAAIIVYFRGSFSALASPFQLKSWLTLPQIRPDHVAEDWQARAVFFTRLSFIILVLTGLVPTMIFAAPVSGIILLLHALAAPVFAVGLAAICLWRAHHNRFDAVDWQFVQSHSQANANRKQSAQGKRFGKKVSFWLTMIVSLPLIFSIFLSMFPFFGTDGQETLLQLHGYSALVFLIIAFARLYMQKQEEVNEISK